MKINLSFVFATSVSLIFICCFTTCTNDGKHGNIEFENSLESIKGWDPAIKTIETDGHSGRYVSFADSSQIYNYGFHLPLKEITGQRIYQVNAKVWARCTSTASNSNLVISLQDGGNHIAYGSTRVETIATNPDQWFAITTSLEIPANAKPGNELYVFVSNPTKDRVFFDDMAIEIVTIR